MNRGLHLFSIALAVGLVFDLLSMGIYAVWSVRLPIPFLFELTFAVLVLKDLPRWSLEGTAVMADRMFGLKDRLYSFLWYGNHPEVPERIRSAQILETLGAVDLQSQTGIFKVRIPVTLFATIPLFCTLLYLSWNAEYVPPGISTRIISLTRSPDPTRPPPVRSPGQTGAGNPSAAGTAGERTGDRPGKMDAAEEVQRPSPDSGSPDSATAALSSVPEDEESAVVPGSSAGDGGGGGGGATGLRGPEPGNLRSNPVSRTVSEPVPPRLAAQAALSFLDLPEASRFLDLVPGQGSGSLARLDEETVSLFEDYADRFPDRYRSHLQTYYQELKQWSLNR